MTSPAVRLTPATPPVAEARPVVSTCFGVEIVDDFGWLRAENWQAVMQDPSVLDPAIRAHLDAENVHARTALAPTEALQARLFAEMKARIREDDSSVPALDGPFAYAVRHREGGQHPIHVRSPRDGGAEEILLDGDARAAGKAYFRLSGVGHSPDHRRLVGGADENGSEYFTLRVRDLVEDRDLADTIEATGGDAVWSADG